MTATAVHKTEVDPARCNHETQLDMTINAACWAMVAAAKHKHGSAVAAAHTTTVAAARCKYAANTNKCD